MTHQPNIDVFPDGTRIGRTALCVSDLDGVTNFYQTVVGLDVLHRTEKEATLGADETPLLVLERDRHAPARHRSETGLYHTAFRVPSRAALGDALHRIYENWRLDGAADHHVSEALYFTDPEDNGVEMYRDFPREQWPLTDDGQIRMATEPLDLGRIEAAATGASRAPPGTDVGHIHLEVSSLEVFSEWYVETLGFELQATIPGARFVSAGGYHHHIGANTWHHRTTAGRGRGLSWFELVFPDSDALDAVQEQLSGRELPVRKRENGIAVADPDDNEIRLRAEETRK